MNVYYNRPSDRVSEGEPNRIARNFRLHPDRIADLEEIARVWNVTKSAGAGTDDRTGSPAPDPAQPIR